jgi:hypothetical protein
LVKKTQPDTCLVFIFYFLTQFPWESRGANHEQNQAQREVHIVSSSYGLISLTKIAHLSKQVPKVILLFANLLVFAITDISECVAIIICRLRILESLKLATKENRNANVRFPVPVFDHEEKGGRRRLGPRSTIPFWVSFIFGFGGCSYLEQSLEKFGCQKEFDFKTAWKCVVELFNQILCYYFWTTRIKNKLI